MITKIEKSTNVGFFSLGFVSFWNEECSQLDVREAHFESLQIQRKKVRPECDRKFFGYHRKLNVSIKNYKYFLIYYTFYSN